MAVPKKRTSKSKKKNRHNVWERKAYRAAVKALTSMKRGYRLQRCSYDGSVWRSLTPKGFSSSFIEQEDKP